jgi:hypothetical protein
VDIVNRIRRLVGKEKGERVTYGEETKKNRKKGGGSKR